MDKLKSSPCHNLTSFIKDVDDVNKPKTFQGLNVSGNKYEIDSPNRSMQALVSGTITYLENHFALDSVISDLEIFDPTNWPTSATDHSSVVAYGNTELSRILDHFVLLVPESLHEEVKEQ